MGKASIFVIKLIPSEIMLHVSYNSSRASTKKATFPRRKRAFSIKNLYQMMGGREVRFSEKILEGFQKNTNTKIP
jgi:hypothetical protein